MPATIHLHPTAPLAERVMLPGDPGRALLLAQSLLEQPRMFNHNRGLWGYSGTAIDGAPLTIQSTGMGGPSMAIVASELIALGARLLLRVGTCGALERSLQLGDLLVADEVIALDGTSRALGAGERLSPSGELLAPLAEVDSVRRGPVASTDLFYDSSPQDFIDAGALAVEMESATLFALAARRERVHAATLLAVSDLLLPERQRIDPESLREAEQRLGQSALLALRARAAA